MRILSRRRPWIGALLATVLTVAVGGLLAVHSSPTFRTCVHNRKNDQRYELRDKSETDHGDIAKRIFVYTSCTVRLTDLHQGTLAAVFAACLVSVGILQSIIYWRQTGIMGEQARELTRSTDAAVQTVGVLSQSERAVLVVVYVDDNLREMEDNLRASLTAGPDGKSSRTLRALRPVVRYKFKNYGKTPAFLDSIDEGIAWASALPDVPEYEPNLYILRERAIAAGSETTVFECRESIPITPSEAQDTASNRLNLWFYGRVLYRDIFGNPHIHRFLYHWDRQRRHFAPVHDNRYCEDT